jgi:hypothetical protein
MATCELKILKSCYCKCFILEWNLSKHTMENSLIHLKYFVLLPTLDLYRILFLDDNS